MLGFLLTGTSFIYLYNEKINVFYFFSNNNNNYINNYNFSKSFKIIK